MTIEVKDKELQRMRNYAARLSDNQSASLHHDARRQSRSPFRGEILAETLGGMRHTRTFFEDCRDSEELTGKIRELESSKV